jgi:hypothetical protein
MDIAFVEEKDKFIVIYLDDINMYSYSDIQHLQHLKYVFEKCRRFGISLNPKNSNFSLQEGKLLGHIISRYGIKIDPNRVASIQKISIPRSKKEVQSFLGSVNVLRMFIPNLAQIIKRITNMLRKGSEIKWTVDEKHYFEEVKEALTKSLVLISPILAKGFFISFASENTIAWVLTQKNNHNQEQPISFFSRSLRD